MSHVVKLITNYEYKRQFLPEVTEQVLHNQSNLQLYRIEDYLKDIVIPVPPYRTSFNFLILVTGGYIGQQLGTEDYTVGAGQVLNIKQGSITRTLELSEDISGFYVIYENEIISDIALNKTELNFFFTAPFINLSEKVIRWVSNVFLLLEAEIQDSNCLPEICTSLFTSVLLKIIHQSPYKPYAITRSIEISYLFREHVQHDHMTNRDVLYYAKKMALSETYLNKCVKETTGKPPKQWINEISILHSQLLLQDMTMEIAEIAYQLNYQSASYFSRVFKKVKGCTPSVFRAQLTGST
ncbi:AraC family transcriptional regulator [Pedobacter cryoconitis]|uniref:AraC-like DNA-binding protein n=1 Tax=Pedobacter cryoconitis TaxID=188932 RepID=A0A7X0J7F3_9SPHI|nr:helix-turn-helix domain-containing protein [Pedobacter cryoconitis]MBB6501056.1 AraC-like DNA-binding protein [Pedobacter cryoconitis]